MKRLLKPLSLLLTLSILISVMTISVFSATNDDNQTGAEVKVDVSSAYTNSTESYSTYTGTDLGAKYTKSATTFKVWAPSASKVQLKLYKTGSDTETGAGVVGTYDMTKDSTSGVWSATQQGDLNGTYYTYLVTVNGVTKETRDVYSNAVGVNGKRSMVVDLASTNPDGWSNDSHVLFNDQTDAMVWEVSVRDFSLNSSSGVDADKRGKFLGMAQHGTTLNGAGSVKTGIDYLIENHINCVQIMPMYDFGSVDETKGGQNWGYDPYNYNVPEGSFSSDPYHGDVRIRELKTMIKALHDAGISVIMDVVYNHVYGTEDSSFEMTVPGYYFRMNGTKFLDGSGCGNVTASDKKMYRKFMVDSLKYWANEYHIDGFRFDLMGCHDITTMNTIRKELDTIDKRIIMYGEPWMADWSGGNGIANSAAAILDNVASLDARVGCFDDKARGALKGDVNDTSQGFIQGSTANDWGVKAGCMAGVGTMWGGKNKAPSQIVHYLSCHDNLTLWDKILKSCSSTDYNGTNATYLSMNKLAAAFTFTSQGIAFTQAGEEFARTKNGDHNSYKSGDEVNKFDWNRVSKYKDLVDYYKGLRMIRKVYSPFNDGSTTSVAASYFVDTPAGCVAYTMQNKTPNAANEWGMTAVILNGSSSQKTVTLKAGTTLPSQWATIVNGSKAGLTNLGTVSGSTITVPARSAMVLVDKASFDAKNIKEPTGPVITTPTVTTTSTTTAPNGCSVTYITSGIKGYADGTKREVSQNQTELVNKTFEPVDGYKIVYAKVTLNGVDVTAAVYDSDTNTLNAINNGELKVTLVAVKPSKTYLYGDVNNDNSVDVRDATAVQKYSAGSLQLSDIGLKAADVNKSESVDIRDATLIQKFVAGNVIVFPAGKEFSDGTPDYTIPTEETTTATTTTTTTTTVTQTVTTPIGGNTVTIDASAICDGQERFALYAFGGSLASPVWLDMTGGSGIYSAEVPDGCDGFIFVRMNGSTTENQWNMNTGDDYVWGQSEDLKLGSDRYYIVSGWGSKYGQFEGTWTTPMRYAA